VVMTEFHTLLRSYHTKKNRYDTKIEIANSLFADDSFSVKEDYQNMLKQFYLTKVRAVDFSDSSESVDTINSWVRNKTSNLIQELLSADSVDETTRMVLLNAVYFKANWLHKFLIEDTTKAPFSISKTKEVTADFMTYEGRVLHEIIPELDDATVVALPYEDTDFQMLIVLPNENSDIEALQDKIFGVDLKNISNQLQNKSVILSLPKFKLGYETSLRDAFIAMNASKVFGRQADLGLISNEDNLGG